MSTHKKPKGLYLEREMIESPAFRRLSATAIRILFAFLMRRTREKKRIGKRETWITTNAHELEFTYKQAQRELGISSATFCENRDRLIEVGFLDVVVSGSGLFRSKSVYSLGDRWKKYETDDFENVNRPRAGRHIGFQNMWTGKSRKSGRSTGTC